MYYTYRAVSFGVCKLIGILQQDYCSSRRSCDDIEDDRIFSSLSEVLTVLQLLYKLGTSEQGEPLSLTPEDFHCHKLINKISKQLRVCQCNHLAPSTFMFCCCLCHQDPLVLCSGSVPTWCRTLCTQQPMLIPYGVRQDLFTSTAFGVSRLSLCYLHLCMCVI